MLGLPGTSPYYFDAALQGSRNQDMLWLIDGVRITNRLYNGTSPLDTVPAHMIERIEVLKGGQGIFYGTQSVGGVINVVTKGLQQETVGAVSASANTHSGYGLNGYYRGGNDQVQFVAYASKDEFDGYQPWRDRERTGFPAPLPELPHRKRARQCAVQNRLELQRQAQFYRLSRRQFQLHLQLLRIKGARVL